MRISKQTYTKLVSRQIEAIPRVVDSTSFACSTPGPGYQPVGYQKIPIPRAFLKNAFIDNVGVGAVATRLLS
jgi:hypothetical protein